VPDSQNHDAWNNFVMNSQPEDYPAGSAKRAAAIAKLYMGQANNGGLNSFLTYSWEFDAAEVLEALLAVGAQVAAKEFDFILHGLGVPVPAQSQEARWDLMLRHWSEEMNDHDFLSDAADKELMRVLEQYVRDNEEFYLALE
jgi:hypothetical protein